jgi:hypothetical protein
LPDFSSHNIPKRGKIYQNATKLPIGHKMYQMAVLIPYGPKIYNLFHSKALQNLTKLGFLV